MNATATLTLHRVDPATDAGWALFPKALRRVVRFCEVQPTELRADEMTVLVTQHFMARSPALGLWVVVDSDDLLVAHLFAMFDAARRAVFIFQLEIDRPLPRGLRRDATQALEVWARGLGAAYLEAVTWQPTRLWARYGFHEHRRTVRRVLNPRQETSNG